MATLPDTFLTVDEQIQDLKNRRNIITVQLSNMSPTDLGGKPNSSGPGANVENVRYRLSLYQELQMIREQIVFLEGPVEIEHLGMP